MNREFDFMPELPMEKPLPVDSGSGRPGSDRPTAPQLFYQVAMPEPESHLFEVTLRVMGWPENLLDLKMPVWTPGSYLVREYARHLQDFAAFAGTTALPWSKVSKHHWQIHTQGNTDLTITYRIFANELTVRTNHLDGTHGYFNGAAIFFFVPGYEDCPIDLAIAPPRLNWQVATALPAVPGQVNHFRARNFDMLVDSPVEIGTHQRYPFEVLDKPHELVVWGTGNYQVQQLIPDIQKIIAVEADLFGGLPYDRYLFLLHLAGQGFGGLEHKDSCSLIYQRFSFRSRDKYNRFMQLVAHEFFHLWNVKRIRPQALEVFDYEQENYTPSLWFCEGTTSYYDLLIPLRAGIYDVPVYLTALSQEISRFLTTPGRKVQPLGESSFDAWIKLYRPDANSPNSQMSYYLKGEMVSLLLDLLIRARSGNRRSLDAVMRQMWHQFGKSEIGYTPEQLQQVLESVVEIDLTEFLSRYLETTEELPFDDYLAPFGLCLKPEGVEDGVPALGITVKTESGREMIKFVERGSPAQRAGLDPGDELLAINGIRVSGEQLPERLRDFKPGDALQVTFFHQDELRSQAVTLAPPQPTRYRLLPVAYPTGDQERNFVGWLGASLSDLA
jgi:predicted metalloprotease with PDZ domain